MKIAVIQLAYGEGAQESVDERAARAAGLKSGSTGTATADRCRGGRDGR